MVLYLNKLESHSPKDALCQVWFKQAQRFLRRRFLNFVNMFSLFRNYLPLEKGVALYLNQIKQKRFREEVVKSGGRTKQCAAGWETKELPYIAQEGHDISAVGNCDFCLIANRFIFYFQISFICIYGRNVINSLAIML